MVDVGGTLTLIRWATDILEMNEAKREVMGGYSWKIEEYHRGIKQFCGVENCQARKNQSQRAHIMFSLRAFLRLEVERLRTGRSWFESKREIIRQAIRGFLITYWSPIKYETPPKFHPFSAPKTLNSLD